MIDYKNKELLQKKFIMSKYFEHLRKNKEGLKSVRELLKNTKSKSKIKALKNKIKLLKNKIILFKKAIETIKGEIVVLKEEIKNYEVKLERKNALDEENNHLKVGDVVSFKRKNSLSPVKKGIIKKISDDSIVVECDIYSMVLKREEWIVWKKYK